MKKGLLFILLTLPAIMEAQTNISGKVKNAKGKALAGINIVLKDTYDGTTTDSLGNFSFTTTETGLKILEITATNFKPLDVTILEDIVLIM